GRELQVKGFAAQDGKLLETDVASLNREADRVLPLVIDRNVLTWLKQAEFANFLGRNAAGRQVRDTSACESKPDVSNVHSRGEDRNSGCPDLVRHLFRKAQDDVKIVDHQVEHNVDIETSRREDTEAVNFEEKRNGKRVLQHCYCRIEALQMSNLEDAPALLGEPGESFAGGRRGGNWLFNQDIDTAVQQTARNGFVSNGRCRHNRGVKTAERLIDAGECARVMIVSNLLRSFQIGIDDGRQFNILKLPDHATVIPSERAGADDRHPELLHSF